MDSERPIKKSEKLNQFYHKYNCICKILLDCEWHGNVFPNFCVNSIFPPGKKEVARRTKMYGTHIKFGRDCLMGDKVCCV